MLISPQVLRASNLDNNDVFKMYYEILEKNASMRIKPASQLNKLQINKKNWPETHPRPDKFTESEFSKNVGL